MLERRSISPPVCRRLLPNGLAVVGVELPHAHRVALELSIAVGPRYETREQNGISHFLEHMVHRGIPSHPTSHEQALAFERRGAELSAATYIDHGTLGVSVPAEELDAVLPLFRDVFQTPMLEGIGVEKGIVLEELLEEVDERGRIVDADVLLTDACFSPHPLGQPILGSEATIQSFDHDALTRHHQATYVGRRTVLASAGPWPPAMLVELAAELFSGVPTGEAAADDLPAPQRTPRFRAVHDPGSQTALRVGFRGPGVSDAGEAATALLLKLVDDGMSTRLYHRLCNDLGLCYDVSAGYEAFSGIGLIDFAAEAAHERVAVVLSEILDLARRLRDEGPSDEELDTARARARWQFQTMLEDPIATASFYGLGTLYRSAPDPEARMAELSTLTPADVQRAAQRAFRRESLSVVAVGALRPAARARMERLVDHFE